MRGTARLWWLTTGSTLVNRAILFVALAGCARSHLLDGSPDTDPADVTTPSPEPPERTAASSCYAETPGDPETLILLRTFSPTNYNATLLEVAPDGNERELVVLPIGRWYPTASERQLIMSPGGRYTLVLSDDFTLVDLETLEMVELRPLMEAALGSSPEDRYEFSFRGDGRALLGSARPHDEERGVVGQLDLDTLEWTEVERGCNFARYTEDHTCRIYRRQRIDAHANDSASSCYGPEAVYQHVVVDAGLQETTTLDVNRDETPFFFPGHVDPYVSRWTSDGICERLTPEGRVPTDIPCNRIIFFSQDGRYAAVNYGGGEMSVFDLRAEETRSVAECDVGGAVFSPDGREVFCDSFEEAEEVGFGSFARYLIDTDAGTRRLVGFGGGSSVLDPHPRFSVDGTTMLLPRDHSTYVPGVFSLYDSDLWRTDPPARQRSYEYSFVEPSGRRTNTFVDYRYPAFFGYRTVSLAQVWR